MRAADIAKALHGRRSGRGCIACCPAHHDRRPSLSITDGPDGKLLLHCFSGCDFKSILQALRRRLPFDKPERATPEASTAIATARAAEARDIAKRRRLAEAIRRERLPAKGSLVETYLRARAIANPPLTGLGFHPALRHPAGVVAPAMLAPIVDVDGALIGLHSTWLAADGAAQADLKTRKAMLGSALGGAVRLTVDGGELVVAEGIETALSLADALPDRAVWAALSANGLRALDLPPAGGALLIGADGDPAGSRAANDLAMRARRLGWTARIMAAPDGLDWNDVAQRRSGSCYHAE